jgi:DNA polymerase I-like protein with 3'-5' exonuclease and polymerase domains
MNEASNFPPQSISSDITLHAAIRCWKELLKMGVRIVVMVHDSIIMEIPISKGNVIRHEAFRLVAGELRRVPIDYGITEVPFLADAAYGDRWGSLTEYEGDLYA